MISLAQYERTHEAHKKMLQDEAIRIARSSDTRSWLMKNIGKAPEHEVVRRAVECIADLTGDECLRKKVELTRIEQSPYSLREPFSNDYVHEIDNGTPMLKCPDCGCRIQSNPFSFAVGNLGYSFCPYCGKDRRKQENGDT